MGPTSTQRTVEELQAEYDALDNKRSKEGFALRKQIAEITGEGAQPPRDDGDDGVIPSLSVIRQSERKAVYWLGVIPGNAETGDGVPPCHQIDRVGGRVTFYEYWTPFEGPGQDGTPRRGQYLGHLVELTESQVVDLRRGLRGAVVRWRVRKGRHRHGTIVQIPTADNVEDLRARFGLNDKEVARIRIKAEQFVYNPETDEPAARYIYCHKVEGPEAKPGSKWRPSTTPPKSVEEMGRIDGP